MTSLCSITEISTMFMNASHQSSQHAASRADLLLSHLLCLVPRSLLDDICTLSDCSFHKLSADSRADRLVNGSLSASATLLSECVTISDQGCSLRVIQVLVVEGIARVQALREIRIWSPCVIKLLPHGLLLARVDEFELSWDVKRLFCGSIVVELAPPILAHKPDSKLHSHRRILHRLGRDILCLLAVVSTPG